MITTEVRCYLWKQTDRGPDCFAAQPLEGTAQTVQILSYQLRFTRKRKILSVLVPLGKEFVVVQGFEDKVSISTATTTTISAAGITRVDWESHPRVPAAAISPSGCTWIRPCLKHPLRN